MSSTLKKVTGVKDVNANYRNQQVKITYDDSQVSEKEIIKKIEGLGYKIIKK